jgi:hypothetical protein
MDEHNYLFILITNAFEHLVVVFLLQAKVIEILQNVFFLSTMTGENSTTEQIIWRFSFQTSNCTQNINITILHCHVLSF